MSACNWSWRMKYLSCCSAVHMLCKCSASLCDLWRESLGVEMGWANWSGCCVTGPVGLTECWQSATEVFLARNRWRIHCLYWPHRLAQSAKSWVAVQPPAVARGPEVHRHPWQCTLLLQPGKLLSLLWAQFACAWAAKSWVLCYCKGRCLRVILGKVCPFLFYGDRKM